MKETGLLSERQKNAAAVSGSGFVAPTALAVFVLSLAVGLALVAWWAHSNAETARLLARREAQAKAVALEAQFSQASAAAELVGALVKQAGGVTPALHPLAAEQAANLPGIAYIEIQPAGVVSDVVPRVGNERLLGHNVLNDPVQGPAAQDAINRHAGTTLVPLTLANGRPGVSARVTILLRARDGRETFWGFVAAAMDYEEALKRAKVYELGSHGYDYHFYLPAGPQQTAASIVARGSHFREAIHQPVHCPGLEFGLAVVPSSGWYQVTELAAGSLGAVLFAGLIALLVHSLARGRDMEAALAEAEKQVARDLAERTQIQRDARSAADRAESAQAEARQIREAHSQAESTVEQLQERLEAESRSQRELLQAAEEKLKGREIESRQIQARLEASVQAAEAATRAIKAEHEKALTAFAESRKRLSDLEKRAAEHARIEEESRTQIAQMQSRLEAATRIAREKAVPAPKPPATTVAEQAVTSRPLSGPVAVPEPVSEPRPQRDPPGSGPHNLVESKPASVVVASPLPVSLTVGPAKRTRSRRDDQMDLFDSRPALEPLAPDRGLELDPTYSPARLPKAKPADGINGPSAPPAETRDTPRRGRAGTTEEEPRADRLEAREEGLARHRVSRPHSPVDLAELRKAANEILPLFVGEDPGAKDCFRANRAAFRSAFSPESYEEFEQCVRSGNFSTALEQLRKVTKKHGLSL